MSVDAAAAEDVDGLLDDDDDEDASAMLVCAEMGVYRVVVVGMEQQWTQHTQLYELLQRASSSGVAAVSSSHTDITREIDCRHVCISPPHHHPLTHSAHMLLTLCISRMSSAKSICSPLSLHDKHRECLYSVSSHPTPGFSIHSIQNSYLSSSCPLVIPTLASLFPTGALSLCLSLFQPALHHRGVIVTGWLGRG